MTEHGICPGASICYIYSGIKYGEILLVHKFTNEIQYTVSGSTVHLSLVGCNDGRLTLAHAYVTHGNPSFSFVSANKVSLG